MKNTLLKITTVFFLGMTIFSCSPEDGKDGINGTNGTNGTNSNVNVISTPWTNRTFTGSGLNWTTSYAIPDITQSVLDSGLILTFKKAAMDETIQVTNSFTPYFWIYYLQGNVQIDASTNQTGMYRHIIIPRSSSSFEKSLKRDYTKMSYQEICTIYNISE